MIAVCGMVVERTSRTINSALPTGRYELQVTRTYYLNKAKVLPFTLEDADKVDEELRLKYRYLDLRRSTMQNNIALRHKVIFAMREFFPQRRFL